MKRKKQIYCVYCDWKKLQKLETYPDRTEVCKKCSERLVKNTIPFNEVEIIA